MDGWTLLGLLAVGILFVYMLWTADRDQNDDDDDDPWSYA